MKIDTSAACLKYNYIDIILGNLSNQINNAIP